MRLHHELGRMRSAAQEAEIAERMQLGIVDGNTHPAASDPKSVQIPAALTQILKHPRARAGYLREVVVASHLGPIPPAALDALGPTQQLQWRGEWPGAWQQCARSQRRGAAIPI